VSDTAGGEDPENEDGSGEGWVGEDVEESEAEEGEDVLHVVQVGTTHSLNILVHSRFEAFLLLADNILRGDEGARPKPLPGCKERHKEHLDNNDCRIEGKSPKQLLVHVQSHPFNSLQN